MAEAEVKPILLAEDNEADVLLLTRAFKKAGLANPIHAVPHGEAAIAYLRGDGPFAEREKYPMPVLILLDIKMPRATGLEVLEWIRKNLKTNTPVLILTSSAMEEDLKAARELGVDGYLVKPGSFDQLTELVRRLHQRWLIL
jgi:CheY-like chemotaxis protein